MTGKSKCLKVKIHGRPRLIPNGANATEGLEDRDVPTMPAPEGLNLRGNRQASSSKKKTGAVSKQRE